jgi:hypothetical protein
MRVALPARMNLQRVAMSAVRATVCALAVASCGGDPSTSPAPTSEPLPTTDALRSSSDLLSSREMRKDVSLTPLFFTQFVDPAPGPVYVHAAAVDERGNTFVLGHNVRDVNFVYRFDPKGAFVSQTLAAAAEFLDESVLRANDTGFVTAGTQGGGGPSIRVDRFDAGGQRLFQYSGPPMTIAGGADVCRDGTTLVAQATTAGDGAVIAFDTSGEAKWTATFDDVAPTDVRCVGDRSVRVVGASRSGSAVAIALGADGSTDWRYASSDSVVAPGFAVDDGGNTYVAATRVTEGATQVLVVALNWRGGERWRFTSDGPSDSFRRIAANGVVGVTGVRGTELLTIELDPRGRVLWTRAEAAGGAPFTQGVSLDGAKDVFVCASAGQGTDAFLYADRTGATLAFETPDMSGIFADVTRGVARCVGTSGSGIGILAFRVR